MDNSWTEGAGEGDIPAALHRAFQAGLREMAMLARHTSADDFLHQALQRLRAIIPFDAAWWGEAGHAPDQPPRNLLHASIGLRPSFAREWNQHMAHMDEFAAGSMARLGTVFRASGGYSGDNAEVTAFIERHRLHTIMAITLELAGSGLLFFVCLYRHSAHAGFSDQASALFQEYARHLVQHWEFSLEEACGGAAPMADCALSDGAGRLLYLGHAMAVQLECGEPGWRGDWLPAALLSALPSMPCSVALGATRVALAPAGALALVTPLWAGTRPPLLPPRELSTAMLYAQGHSYKEIARLLELSPSTVRTYLRNAYQQLGVRNKVALSAALASSPQQHVNVHA